MEIVQFNGVPWEAMQQHGFRKTSGKMFQALAAHPAVNRAWYVQLDRRFGLSLRHEQVDDKVHVIGLPNGQRGNMLPVLGAVNARRNASQLAACIDRISDGSSIRSYWFYDWVMADLIGHLPKNHTVMELTDHVEDVLPGSRSAMHFLAKLKQASFSLCDLAFAVSPNLLPDLQGCRGPVYVERNAIGKEFLLRARTSQPEPTQLQAIKMPRLGIVGSRWSLNHRIDHPLLAAVAELLPDWQIVIIGCDQPGEELAKLAKKPNVHLAGMQRQDVLPAFIQHVDVCAVPYRPGPPRGDALKVYEYAACRKRTILTVDDPNPGLHCFTRNARDAREFAAACRECLSQPVDAGEIDSIMDNLTWEARADRCLSLVRADVGAK